MHRILGTLLLIWLAFDGSHFGCQAAENQKQAARVAELIELLGDANYHTRMDARWELERIGLEAFGQLREAVNHPNIEIASSARYLVQSQNVIWWLETDSLDVRRLLMDYNTLPFVDRDTRLQELAELGTDDASMALCRLARFESNESLSKSAALYLIQKIVSGYGESSPTLSRSINVTIEDAERPATAWLRTIASDLDSGETRIDRWRDFTEQETADAMSEDGANASQPEEALGRARVLRLYKSVVGWLLLRTERPAALDIAAGSLALVSDTAPACFEYSRWALAEGLPELVLQLAERMPQHFDAHPALRYLMAEAQLRSGQDALAQTTAKEASNLFNIEAEKAKGRFAVNINDIVAQQRRNIAVFDLSSRGLYDWAEAELKLATEIETSKSMQIDVRLAFADFYWAGGKYQDAASALAPLLEDENDAEENLPGRVSSRDEIDSYYHFYLGLAAIEEGDRVKAGELLTRSLELSSNPDVVIAMSGIAGEEPLRSVYQQEFSKMADDYRVQVASKERILARSPDRMTRSSIAFGLAKDCNQLAWLLGKCKASPEEAVNLSLRSLEFDTDNPAYLDTLGRCYFSAGKINEAIRAQRQAVDSAPYDRLMKKQLSEFESALQQIESNPR